MMPKWFRDWLQNRRWTTGRIDLLERQVKDLQHELRNSQLRSNRYHLEGVSARGEVVRLKRKLDRTNAWIRNQYISIQKMKEQSKLDHQFAASLKELMACTESEMAVYKTLYEEKQKELLALDDAWRRRFIIPSSTQRYNALMDLRRRQGLSDTPF